MKVVSSVAELGMRLREYQPMSANPMVRLATGPVLWQMSWNSYAHYGLPQRLHLCPVYPRADAIKHILFLCPYDELGLQRLFARHGGKYLQLFNSDTSTTGTSPSPERERIQISVSA